MDKLSKLNKTIKPKSKSKRLWELIVYSSAYEITYKRSDFKSKKQALFYFHNNIGIYKHYVVRQAKSI